MSKRLRRNRRLVIGRLFGRLGNNMSQSDIHSANSCESCLWYVSLQVVIMEVDAIIGWLGEHRVDILRLMSHILLIGVFVLTLCHMQEPLKELSCHRKLS